MRPEKESVMLSLHLACVEMRNISVEKRSLPSAALVHFGLVTIGSSVFTTSLSMSIACRAKSSPKFAYR